MLESGGFISTMELSTTLLLIFPVSPVLKISLASNLFYDKSYLYQSTQFMAMRIPHLQ